MQGRISASCFVVHRLSFLFDIDAYNVTYSFFSLHKRSSPEEIRSYVLDLIYAYREILVTIDLYTAPFPIATTYRVYLTDKLNRS